jgi:Flp pilus assembly protein TadD
MLEEGLKRAPADPMGSFQVAQLYAKNNRFSDARRVINKALTQPITNRDLYQGLAALLERIPN